jgi:large subunit ribosomal protein L9
MQIILTKKVKTLGNPGEIKDVKRGYAVNFLIPEGLALPATKGFIKEATIMARKFNKSSVVDTEKMADFIKEIQGTELVIKEKASDKGVLFGSVRAEDIVEELAKKISKSIDSDYIVLKEPIKKVGEYEIEIKAGEAKGKLKVKVEAEK